MAEPLTPQRLLDLYKIAIEEYRFEVRLGWDRAMYFLVLNSAILSVATGLLKLEGPLTVYLFTALLFAFGLATSLVGSRSITMAHEYYRRTIVKKTIIEECLGLNNPPPGMQQTISLAIGTTRGQSERMKILSEPDLWVARPHRRGAITYWLRWILRGMAVVDGIGVSIASVFVCEKWICLSLIAPHWWSPLFMTAAPPS
jgi:hypothetical protein